MRDLSKTFGKQHVDSDARTRLIRSVFSRVAPRYDLMNDLMSMGIHRYWKRVMCNTAEQAGSREILDLASGTGDVALALAGPQCQVTVCDPSLEMMQAGRVRDHTQVNWLAGCAENLPLEDAYMDLVTIAFGIRNVTRIEQALSEIHRVLRPGGRLVVSRIFAPGGLVTSLLQHLFATCHSASRRPGVG